MASRTTQSPAEGQLLVSISDLSMLNDIKKAISMLKGVTAVKKQAIEDVRSGKDKGTTYESFEDFKKAMMAL